jgi:hypothetical protein
MPSGPSRCKIHAVYLARMCPIVFKENLVYVKSRFAFTLLKQSRVFAAQLFLMQGNLQVTAAPIFMHISSPRNIPLVERKYGSGSLQHADPF